MKSVLVMETMTNICIYNIKFTTINPHVNLLKEEKADSHIQSGGLLPISYKYFAILFVLKGKKWDVLQVDNNVSKVRIGKTILFNVGNY